MTENAQDILRSLGETLERIAPSLEKLNSAPEPLTPEPIVTTSAATPAQGIADQAGPPVETKRVLSFSDQLEVRSALRKRSNAELHALFADQAFKSDRGIPLDVWLHAGGSGRSSLFGDGYSSSFTPEVRKLLDTSSGAALIRQDLEPILYELFVREFPGFDMFPKEPANGLTHTWQTIDDYGDAQFMGELGTVTDDRAAYTRETTNVAILATRRGVTIKSQFATVQSGSGFNPEQLELTQGLRAIAHRMQYQIFNGHSTDSGGTSSNELGAYDANAFTGLRSILNTGRAKTLSDDALFRTTWNQALVEVMQIGPGRPSVIFLNPIDKEKFDNTQDQNVRYIQELTNVAVGVNTNVVNTVFGGIPLFPIPGDGIDEYTSTVASAEVRDSFLLDLTSMSLPYLGSEGITTLEIPVGVSGQLTRMYIMFGMWGLAVKAPTYSNKVRIKTTLS